MHSILKRQKKFVGNIITVQIPLTGYHLVRLNCTPLQKTRRITIPIVILKKVQHKNVPPSQLGQILPIGLRADHYHA
jgi:hypothetical protein